MWFKSTVPSRALDYSSCYAGQKDPSVLSSRSRLRQTECGQKHSKKGFCFMALNYSEDFLQTGLRLCPPADPQRIINVILLHRLLPPMSDHSPSHFQLGFQCTVTARASSIFFVSFFSFYLFTFPPIFSWFQSSFAVFRSQQDQVQLSAQGFCPSSWIVL